MINSEDLVNIVIKPALMSIDCYSKDAEALLLGTCSVESDMGSYLTQIGNGPALGIFQIEPFTYRDILNNYIRYRPDLARKIYYEYLNEFDGIKDFIDPIYEQTLNRLAYDLKFCATIARVHYLRVPEKLPSYNDLGGQAVYWKRYYNTDLGSGTVDKYISAHPYFRNEK